VFCSAMRQGAFDATTLVSDPETGHLKGCMEGMKIKIKKIRF